MHHSVFADRASCCFYHLLISYKETNQMTGIVNNDHIRELCNNLVLAVEQDVKRRLLSRWQNEMSFQTGMHGEPLEPVARQRGERGQE